MKRSGTLPGRCLPRDARSLAAIRLLQARNADRTAHAHERSLLTHLVGTARLLLLWDAPIETIRAGLCHSIYGTNAFRIASLDRSERAVLQRTIGRRAETLVSLFSTLRRPATLLKALANNSGLVRERSGRTRHLEQATLKQLFLLECANLLDQGIAVRRTRELHRHAMKLSLSSNMLRDLQDLHRRNLLARCTACHKHFDVLTEQAI